MRKFICWLFGHRSICLYRRNTNDPYTYGYGHSEITGWKCERCRLWYKEQWDEEQ